MNAAALLLALRDKFKAEWDPLQCNLPLIKQRFLEGRYLSRDISLATFDTLYRRAACETITERWKETRAAERLMRDSEAAAAAAGGLLFCFDVLFPTIIF